MKIPVIDLFSGAGGLSCGLKRAGLDIRAAVEIDKEAVETYRKNIGDIVLNKDISLVSGKELLKFAKIKKNQIFILAGCPPCQGFSFIGTRNKDDIRNRLAFQYVRLINETKPAFIIMENVPGMSKGIGKEIFIEIVKQLEKDYIVHYEVLNSADYGVPQKRKRLVLHGISKKIKKKYFPENFKLGTPESTHINPQLKSDNTKPEWLKVDIIKDLPELKAGEKNPNIPNHQCNGLQEINLTRLKHTPHNGGSRKDWPSNLVLDCHKSCEGYRDVYGRMNYNSLAPTITAGCLCLSKGRFGHPTQDRAISAREAARLQSFPDDFEFLGGMGSIGRQIGNAVPPKLAEASGRHILHLIRTYIVKEVKNGKV